MEHLALKSSLDLRSMCVRVREILGLPEFSFDSENETEWGTSKADHVEYNVSRPYEDGTLQGWDDTVPANCNFGIAITVGANHANVDDLHWAADHLIPTIAQKLADGLGIPIHYHRTWSAPGKNIPRQYAFIPNL